MKRQSSLSLSLSLSRIVSSPRVTQGFIFGYKTKISDVRLRINQLSCDKVCIPTSKAKGNTSPYDMKFVVVNFQNSKLNLNLCHYKLKIISTSKQNYNSKFLESETIRILKTPKRPNLDQNWPQNRKL